MQVPSPAPVRPEVREAAPPAASPPPRRSTRQNKGVNAQYNQDYLLWSAVSEHPVTALTTNYVVPARSGLHFGVSRPPLGKPSTPVSPHRVKRHAAFVAPTTSVDDASWYCPSLSCHAFQGQVPVVPPLNHHSRPELQTKVLAPQLRHSKMSIFAPSSPRSPCFERAHNFHDLDEDILPVVSFLSELQSPTDIPPGLSAPKREQHEVSYTFAAKHPELFPSALLQASSDKEMHKMFTKMQVMELVVDFNKQVNSDAIFIPSMLLSKKKYHSDGTMDCVSSRLALNGAMQKEGTYGDTYAATADEATTVCCMSAFQAHALQHGYERDLAYESFDVCGAFLHCPLVSERMIITKIPDNIKHPYAGKMAIVRKSCYGLRQSNKTFADSLNQTILAAGFSATLDPKIYKKVEQSADGVAKRCYVSTHVDDGEAMFNHRPFYDHLITTLEKRYGELKKAPLTGFTGATFQLHSNGAFTRSQEGFILRFLENINVPGLALGKVPSDYTLFEDTSHTPKCDIKLYRSVIGSLIHTLRTRYDVQKEVVHLSSKMSAPTDGDLAKAVLVLRYLSGTPKLGPTYYTKQGPVLSCYVDCSYGCHTDGRSHAGFSLHIGSDNAPFYVSSRKQKDCVAVGSMEGEYVALSAAARKVLEFRYFLEDIGFPQPLPTVTYEDNMSAINLAVAPCITRKSRHIHIRHHFIRDCVESKLIKLVHLPTERMLADFLTKPFGPKKFVAFRDRLFNTACIP